MWIIIFICITSQIDTWQWDKHSRPSKSFKEGISAICFTGQPDNLAGICNLLYSSSWSLVLKIWISNPCLTHIDVAKPNLNSLTHNRAWVKRERRVQSNLWLYRNISPFNRNIKTFKGRDTEGARKSDFAGNPWSSCGRKSSFNLWRKSSLEHCGSVPGDRLTALLVEQEEYW